MTRKLAPLFTDHDHYTYAVSPIKMHLLIFDHIFGLKIGKVVNDIILEAK